jgi:hypothetical protein
MHQCHVCSFPCRSVKISEGGGRFEIDCYRCGQYTIGTIADSFINRKELTLNQVANLSGYIRQNPGLEIREPDLERLRSLLSAAGWSWGYCSAVTPLGWRWIVDAHRSEGRRYIVHSDELLSAFLELEATLLERYRILSMDWCALHSVLRGSAGG